MGRGFQRGQGLRPRDRQRADGRPDRDREVLVRERDPPVQPGGARRRRRARPWPARDCAVSGDDQPRGRRCSDVQLARQVPLLVLAAGHCDQRIA